jgi:hypothetical protein
MPINKLSSGLKLNNPLRTEINQVTQGKKSDYANQVHGVNKLLDGFGVGISKQSAQGVIGNVQKVEAGTMSEISAHLREAKGFGRDAFESFSKGQVKQGAVEAFGSALNTAGAAFKSTFTPTPAEKLGNDPW